MEEINNSGGFLYSWPENKKAAVALSLNLLGINYLSSSLFTILYLCNKLLPCQGKSRIRLQSCAGLKGLEGCNKGSARRPVGAEPVIDLKASEAAPPS